MGLIYAKITLANPVLPQLSPIDAEALVDSGTLHLCIPVHLALQLRLETLSDVGQWQ
ncbi:MAG: hypothetical protein K9L60_01195 [Methylovulum sp.]|jgi:hypothetical protein|nr:hypothetical protein [Methylovulum sp.]MCF7997722.1 hypothetical protein [Methylovulum sp.]